MKIILCDVREMASLSHSLPSALGDRHITQGRLGLLMLDRPEKIPKLWIALKVAILATSTGATYSL
jgi:hypothetical protein